MRLHTQQHAGCPAWQAVHPGRSPAERVATPGGICEDGRWHRCQRSHDPRKLTLSQHSSLSCRHAVPRPFGRQLRHTALIPCPLFQDDSSNRTHLSMRCYPAHMPAPDFVVCLANSILNRFFSILYPRHTCSALHCTAASHLLPLWSGTPVPSSRPQCLLQRCLLCCLHE